MQIVLQLLMKIIISLASEKLLRELIAVGLDQIAKHTENKIDDEVLTPIVKCLRGEQ